MICMHNIRSMHNVGSAFRSADAFGVERVLLSGYTPSPPRIEISKTALGAEEWVPWEYHVDGITMLSSYKDKGWAVYGIEQVQHSLLISDSIDMKKPVIFVFGNEVLGLDDDVLDLCDAVYEVPQYGKKHSLNVSVSVGICLYAAHQSAQELRFRSQK
jgi:23S rRNA (guanosine2251-2'-O)-methyltransferase